MLRDDIIAPSRSPWNSPILVIPKRADASGIKKWRIVVDFRKIKDDTVSLVCKGTMSLCFPESPQDVRTVSNFQCYQLERH
jgi:hypothetical protein